MLSMRPYNCNNLSALVNLVHGKQNDPDGETAASAERATTSPFLVPVGSMCVSVSLYTECNHVAVVELIGSVSLTDSEQEGLCQDIWEWGTGRGCFLTAFGAPGSKKV